MAATLPSPPLRSHPRSGSTSTTTTTSTRPMLPHSLSLGTLPPPIFPGSLPSGQRSVPASAELRLRLGMATPAAGSSGTSAETSPVGGTVNDGPSPQVQAAVAPVSTAGKRASGMVVGAIGGERMTRRNSTYDAWTVTSSSSNPTHDGLPSSGPFDSDSLPSSTVAPAAHPRASGLRSAMPDLVRGQSMPHVPSALGAAGRPTANRSVTVTWDDDIPSSSSTSPSPGLGTTTTTHHDDVGLNLDGSTSAALANLRRDSVSAPRTSTTMVAVEGTGRPMLNRAPGSRDNLSSMASTGVSAPTTPTAASKRKALVGAHQADAGSSSPGAASGLSFNLAPHAGKEDLSPLTRTVDSSLGAGASVSHPSFVPFPQTDPLVTGLDGLGLDDGPAQAGQQHRSVSTSAGAFGGPGSGSGRPTGPLGHRQSLPATFFNPAFPPHQSSQQPQIPHQHPANYANAAGGGGGGAGAGGPGWNPFYLRSPFANGTVGLGGIPPDATFGPPPPSSSAHSHAHTTSYDLRRDSGYGPSPPSSQDLRRGSYSPALGHAPSATNSAVGNQIRRSQSAWHVHDAFGVGHPAAAAAQAQHHQAMAVQAGRSPSFSFASPGPGPGLGLSGANGWAAGPAGAPFGTPQTAAAAAFGGFPGSPLMSLDPQTQMAAFGSPLLAAHQTPQQQQHLLAEVRRQSLAAAAAAASARASIDYGVAGLPPFVAAAQAGVGYGLPGQNVGGGGGRASLDAGRQVARSPMLEDFRANKHRRWDLRDMLGHLADFAGDQLGSRHIQSKLDHASQDERDLVFAEVYPNILPLSMDVFANYVVQKFFELGTPAQKIQLGEALRGHVLELSLQMYGCRVVQKALEFVAPDQQRAIVAELEGEVMQCAKDQNANHVLQRSLERLRPEDSQFITRAFLGQAYGLATHPYGCRVLQRAFEHVPEAQSRPLLEELHQQTHALMTDSYGNYLCQWIITDGPPADCARLISRVRGQVLPLSKHKFASNVVEKAILKANDDDLRAMLEEVLAEKGDGVSTVGIMLKDAFANFPLQKFLVAAKEPQRTVLFDETAAQLAHMRKYSLSYGKYLVAIDKLIASERGTPMYATGPVPGPGPHGPLVAAAQFYV